MFSQFLMLAAGQRTMAEPMGIRQLWILWAAWFATMLACGVICWRESRRAERILAKLDDDTPPKSSGESDGVFRVGDNDVRHMIEESADKHSNFGTA